MSAIFGAFALSEAPLAPDLAERMDRALAHRPADAVGTHVQAGLVLGARALWVTPEAVGRGLPYRDPRSGVLCVADARLDNRAELCATLGLDARQSCDEALIATAYERWGTELATELLGDFAFALFDPRTRTLLLARDPYGLRSLYYARTPHALLFASQAKPLFAHPELACRLEPRRVAAYLAREFPDAERTFFRGVLRLAPGHVLRAHGGTTQLSRYFAFDEPAELRLPSSSAYTERFRELLVDAVRVRMRTQLPLGCMLSGGLDSSGVLGAMRELEPSRTVPCFSARFRDFPDIDEGEWLRLHDARGGIERAELDADRIGPLDDVDWLHDCLDEPFHAPNLFVYVHLAKLARERGTRVLLDGLDGDTVVEHGLFFLHELLVRGRVRRLARELGAVHRRTGFGYGELTRAYVLGPTLMRGEALRKWLGPAPGYLSRDFARASGFVAEQRASVAQELRAPSRFRALHTRAVTAPIMPFYLEVHDKAAAALGVDHRHPFFDRRLITFCLSLPPEQRLHDGWDRVIERRAFAGLVPERIQARQSKSVWTLNFQTQLLARHRERLEALCRVEGPLAPFCDVGRLQHDLGQLRAGDLPARVLDVWCAVTLGLWLERHHVTL